MGMTDINQLAREYSVRMRQVLDRHAPLMSRKIVERPRVPWFTKELKELKIKRRNFKAESDWRKNKCEILLQLYQKARTTYVNALNSSRTSHFTDMISSAGNDAKKLFGIVNTLCNKSRDNPLPDHVSELALVNEFGQFFQDKISKIQRAIGPSEPPHMQHRNGTQL